MSDRLVEERLSRIAEQVAQAQRNSEATERVREQADSLEVWTARCFSDTACLGFQAAFVKFRSSRSTSFGVRYPRAE